MGDDGDARTSSVHSAEPASPVREPSRLAEVAAVFLRLGFTAFGGPAAHVAMIEEEVVKRRQWIDRRRFLDLVSAVNFIPGPNSTELAIHLGLIRAGYPGLFVAGVCFIVPAMLIILPIGWLYVRYGRLPDVAGPIAGIRACIVAIVAAAMWRFARAGVKDRFTGVVAAVAVVAAFVMQDDRWRVPQAELIILALAAVAGAVRHRRPSRAGTLSSVVLTPMLATGASAGGGAAAGLASATPWALVLFFLKIGATLFGSGYVLVSYLRGGLVEDHGWMNAQELTDAIAVGQVTPGPLLTTATFVGYLLGQRHGGPGAAVVWAVAATVAIFLPSFCFVAILGKVWDRLSRSALARGALDGMNAAVVALILVVSVQLARDALGGVAAGVIAAVSLLVLLLWNVNSTWLVLAAAAAGFALQRVGGL